MNLGLLWPPPDTFSNILPESAQHCFLIDVLSGLPILAFQVGLLCRFVCCVATKFCCDAAFKLCGRLWTGSCELFRVKGTPLASRWGRYMRLERVLQEATNLGEWPKIRVTANGPLGGGPTLQSVGPRRQKVIIFSNHFCNRFFLISGVLFGSPLASIFNFWVFFFGNFDFL